MWEILGPATAAFLIGLARGMTVCLMLCAPGMIPLILNEKAGMARSMFLGFLLSLPRMLLLTLLGAVLGYISFELFRQDAVAGALTAISAASYILLGLLLLFVGMQLLREHEKSKFDDGGKNQNDKNETGSKGKGKGNDRSASRKGKGEGNGRRGRDGRSRKSSKAVTKDDGDALTCVERPSWWQRTIFAAAKRFYPSRGKSQKLFLLWGGLLSLACVGEISGEAGLLAVMSTNTAAGTGTIDPALGAGIGAFIMFIFSLGATVPILITAAVGGSLTKRIKDKEMLATIRGACAMLMVGLGLYFFLREIYIIFTLTKIL
jgi:sulfite exporter TauE/SafE